MQLTVGDIIIYITVLFGLYTSIFFLLTLLEGIPKTKKRRLTSTPRVAVLIPCYNEEHTVARTIESVLHLNYPRKLLDIIVIDDGSTDGTLTVAKKYEKHGVRVLHKKNGGKYTALNLGIKHTDARFVAGLDADSHVHPQALKRMLPHFQDEKVMAVTPSMKIHEPKKGIQKIQWTEFVLGIFLRKIFTFLGAQHVTPGPFSLYRTEFFAKHGGYKQAHHTEDIEVALRIQSLNYEIENSHDAYVYTHGPDTFRGLWNQRIRWYYGFLRNVEDYKHLFSRAHGVLGLFVLPGAMFSILLVATGVIYWVVKMLMNTWDKFVYYNAIGWDLFQWNWTFDSFFVSMNSVAILGWIALLTGVLIILLAKEIAGEREIMVNYLWFFAFYWILYGVWWIATILARISGWNVNWKHKSEL